MYENPVWCLVLWMRKSAEWISNYLVKYIFPLYPSIRFRSITNFPGKVDSSLHAFSYIPSRALIKYSLVFMLLFSSTCAVGQTLSLKEAVNSALINYGTIKAKGNYLKASQASVKQASDAYLPNLNLAAQQAYGTANGQFGPVIAIGGLNAASSGPPFLTQNWNAAFGGLYLANISWDFFTFGRVQENVKVAEAQVVQDASDLDQEKFQLEVRVSGVYLNLLAAQRIKISQQKNLERASELLLVVSARTKNGLNPGVDSSQANAEVSNAKIALTNAVNYEADQAGQLAQLMGIPYQDFHLDTVFVGRIPSSLYDSIPNNDAQHPILKYYQSRIDVSRQQEKYFDRFKYPVFSLVGVLQSRGSGFESNYSQIFPDNFTHNYWNGVKPTNSNYLLGIGVTWNLTNPIRVRQQVTAQEWTSKGLQNEYELVSEQIKTQLALADQKIKYAVANYHEAPIQMKAASDAYLQKSVLYKNGLANIVDVTQALYILNRAETDRDISYSNIWQALLLKAAASGDFSLFQNEIR
jgi:outer membrane protein TolC